MNYEILQKVWDCDYLIFKPVVRWPNDWLLEIAFVCNVGMCVCVHP